MSTLGKMLGFGRNSHYDNGVRMFDKGQYEEAISELDCARVVKNGKRDAMTERLALFYTSESFTQMGHKAMKAGAWEKAEQCFTKSLEINPQYADLHFHQAMARRAEHKLEKALDSLYRALEINPRFAKASFYKGLIRYEQEFREDAIESICCAIELEPGFKTEAFHKAMEYHGKGEFLAALQAFEQVSHTEVDDILFHYRLGDDYLRRGLYESAIGEYQKALSLNPNYADIHNHLGIAFNSHGKTNDAISTFQAALAINPKFLDATLNLGIALRDAGRKSEAAHYFSRVLELDPENATAQTQLLSSALPKEVTYTANGLAQQAA